jgi:hypothetical protein
MLQIIQTLLAIWLIPFFLCFAYIITMNEYDKKHNLEFFIYNGMDMRKQVLVWSMIPIFNIALLIGFILNFIFTIIERSKK